MKKWMFALMTAFMLMAGAALADSEGAIVQSSCSVVPSGDYCLVYCYAQVHNNSSDIICLEQGTFELHSGEQLLASQAVDGVWPSLVNPGEVGYMFDVVVFEPDENGQTFMPQITGVEYDIQYMTVESSFASLPLDAQAEIVRDARGGMTVNLLVSNNSGADAFDPTIAFGLYTDGGAMVYADGSTLRNIGIPAGDSMLMRFPVDEEIVAQWDTYGANVTQANVSACFRNDAD